MRTIDITEILSQDLKSRALAQDFNLFIQNTEETAVIVDFANVKFATRSFVDEFYNIFIQKKDTNSVQVKLQNIPPDIEMIFNTVETTQHKAKSTTNTGSVVQLDTISDVQKFFSTLML